MIAPCVFLTIGWWVARPVALTEERPYAAALRMDADRVGVLLTRALEEHGVVVVWETLLRPALTGIGDRWAEDVARIAAEHLLSECATRLLHQAMGGASAPGPPAGAAGVRAG